MSESKVLTALGLSNYEADAYVALLSLGVTSADKVSSVTNIPYGRIYNVLNSLAKRGIVNIQKSRPKMFIAVEPMLALKRLLEARKKDLDREYDHLIKLASEIENQLSAKVSNTEKTSVFWTVAVGKEEAMRLIVQMIDEAQEEILFYGGNVERHYPELSNAIEMMARKFAEVSKRGIKIRILFGFEDTTIISNILSDKAMSRLLGSQDEASRIRFIEASAAPYDVVDEERVLIKIGNPVKPDEYFAAIAVWDRKLATELRNRFEELWTKGKPLTIKLGGSHSTGLNQES